MKTTLMFAVTIAALLGGCATEEGVMTIQPAVRKMSYTDDTLFRDLLTQRGGVGYADFELYPHSHQKVLTKIEVIVPYDNHKTGVERWYIQHDGHDTCSYLVTLKPDGHGGTDWSVQRENNSPAALR